MFHFIFCTHNFLQRALWNLHSFFIGCCTHIKAVKLKVSCTGINEFFFRPKNIQGHYFTDALKQPAFQVYEEMQSLTGEFCFPFVPIFIISASLSEPN